MTDGVPGLWRKVAFSALLSSLTIAGASNAWAQRTVTTFDFSADNLGTFSLDTTAIGSVQLDNPSTLTTGANTFRYASEQFQITETGAYDFGQSSAPLDTVLIVYEGSFDPNNPGQNALAGNDDSIPVPEVARAGCPTSTNRCPGLNQNLIEGTVYVVVVSHFATGQIGSFTLPQSFYIVGPGTAAVGDEIGTEIDNSSSFFDELSAAFIANQPTFNGGILRLGSNQTVQKVILVRAAGGTIDPNSSTLVLEGNIIGEGLLTINGDGTVVIEGETSNSGGFEVEGGSRLSGNGTVNGVTTINDGTLSPGASPGILTFNNDVTLSDQSITEIEVDGGTAGIGAGFFDRIVLNGSGSAFAADGTLTIRLRGITGDANNDFSPSLGQVFDGIVQAEGGVTGGYDSLTQPTDGLPDGTRFDVIYQDTEIDLVLTPADYGDLGVLGIAETDNRKALGGALEAVRPDAGVRADGDVAALFDALAPLSEDELPDALDSLAGQINADMTSASLQVRRSFGTGIMDRMAFIRSGMADEETMVSNVTLSSGSAGSDVASATSATGSPDTGPSDGPIPNPDVWARGVFDWADTDGNGSAAGWESDSAGFIAGADAELVPGFTTGFAVSYLNTDVETNGSGGVADFDSYQVAATGSVSLGDFYTDLAVGYGFSSYETRRLISVGSLQRTSVGETDAHSAFADVEAGFNIPTSSGLNVEPFAGLRYDWISRNGFTETGAGDLSLSVDDDLISVVQPRLGARVDTQFDVNEIGVSLTGRLAVAYDLGAVNGETDQGLLGSSFEVESPDPSDVTVLGGAEISVKASNIVDLFASYSGTIRTDSMGHSANAGLRLSF